MKSKIVIIYGKDDFQNHIKEGQMENLGDVDSDMLHVKCLLDFVQSKYHNVPIFQKLNICHNPETISFYINEILGHIVFLNTTKNVERYGYSGLFLMPKNITDKQKESLYLLSESLKQFSITIGYNMYVDDGILCSTELATVNHQTPTEVLDIFFQKIKEKNR